MLNSTPAPDLARKFGITSGCSVLLIDAPEPSSVLLRGACPPGVTFTKATTPSGSDTRRYDMIFLWLQTADDLVARFMDLQWRIAPDGAIWVMLLKKPVARARGVTLTWDEMQAAMLQTDLVDNKIASFSEEEYGTRFVIRRDRRAAYMTKSTGD